MAVYEASAVPCPAVFRLTRQMLEQRQQLRRQLLRILRDAREAAPEHAHQRVFGGGVGGQARRLDAAAARRQRRVPRVFDQVVCIGDVDVGWHAVGQQALVGPLRRQQRRGVAQSGAQPRGMLRRNALQPALGLRGLVAKIQQPQIAHGVPRVR